MKTNLQRALIIILAGTLLGVAVWSGLQVYNYSAQRAEIKKDYSVLNNITYGLLSVNAWRDHIVNVVTHRIDDFDFSPKQEAIMKDQISVMLHSIISKADSMVNKKQKTLKGKLKKFAYKTFVNEDKIQQQVPVFAQTIVNEMKKSENKKKLKTLVRSKLSQFGSITYDSVNDIKRVESILHKYDVKSVSAFNARSEVLLSGLQEKSYFFTYVILTIMVLFLILWWALRNYRATFTPFFVISVLLALAVLFVGLTAPMIEIDARIKEMSFILVGEKISFHDQVIFFQSKSIVDVVHILIETGKYDSVLVGVLILIFSILFPIAKLLSTKAYLLGDEKWKSNKIINFFAFKSGKWSMADVNVVAIFMAYIGFKGILDSQLSNLNMKTESLASISTNETTLQPGFMLFLAFVLFGLVLSMILKYITSLEPKVKLSRKKAKESSSVVPSVA